MGQTAKKTADKVKGKYDKHGKYGYMFIAPFFIIYAVFQLYPLLYTLFLSTQMNYSKGLNEVGPEFIGLKNYLGLFIDTKVTGEIRNGSQWFDTKTMLAMRNTFIMWIMNFIPQIALSYLLAAWFTDTRVKLKGQGAYKIMVYMPNIITAASISVLFYTLFNYTGPITATLRNIGILPDKFDFMNSKIWTQILIAFINFWMWYGNTMILLVAGILGISPSLFEAAQVDGASSGQIFWKVTMPLLRPISVYVLITSLIGGLQMYDIPSLFNITSVGDALPDYASMTITMYIRSLINSSKDYGKASTVSVLLFVVTLVISLIFFYVTSEKTNDYGEKKKLFRKKGA